MQQLFKLYSYTAIVDTGATLLRLHGPIQYKCYAVATVLVHYILSAADLLAVMRACLLVPSTWLALESTHGVSSVTPLCQYRRERVVSFGALHNNFGV